MMDREDNKDVQNEWMGSQISTKDKERLIKPFKALLRVHHGVLCMKHQHWSKKKHNCNHLWISPMIGFCKIILWNWARKTPEMLLNNYALFSLHNFPTVWILTSRMFHEKSHSLTDDCALNSSEILPIFKLTRNELYLCWRSLIYKYMAIWKMVKLCYSNIQQTEDFDIHASPINHETNELF